MFTVHNVVLCCLLSGFSYVDSAAIAEIATDDVAINPRGLFTKHCGPGQLPSNVTYKSQTVRAIDECCRIHDECPDYVSTLADYSRYPELELRPMSFSKMDCNCDFVFLQCLGRINSFYARSIRLGYVTVQHKCFQYEHPVEQCLQSTLSFIYGARCSAYLVDVHAPKRWQWFDIPVGEPNKFPRLYYADYSTGGGMILINDYYT